MKNWLELLLQTSETSKDVDIKETKHAIKKKKVRDKYKNIFPSHLTKPYTYLT